MGLSFADFVLSFLLSGEEERLTERARKVEKVEIARDVTENYGKRIEE